jgi:catechol 2,3-dioxygenase-like lactoylglutathione lyase family enzyme
MQLAHAAHATLTLSLLAYVTLVHPGQGSRPAEAGKAAAGQQPAQRAGETAGAETSVPLATSLGAFSLSIAVKDLAASRAFYEKLGFTAVPGKAQERWIILRNGPTTLGLFQGFFDKNSLTFNPGWTWDNQPLPDFTDVRELQRQLEAKGLVPGARADENSTGPAFFTLTDPDGNPVLFDQHVDKPAAK